MKKYLVTQICLFLLFIFTFQYSFAQMKIGTFFGINYWGETDNNQKIEAIGIGDYTFYNSSPNSALDINIHHLYQNGLRSAECCAKAGAKAHSAARR